MKGLKLLTDYIMLVHEHDLHQWKQVFFGRDFKVLQRFA